MIAPSAKDLLAIGLYTPSEAAFYARVHPAAMARWIHGDRRGEPALRAQLEGDPERKVTFLDFVQALAIREIRRDHKVSLQKIRDAVQVAQRDYGVDYPFAMRHTTFLFGQEILIQIQGRDGPGLVQVSGTQKHQRMIRKVAELFMEELTFGEAGLATRYRIFRHLDQTVAMDPRQRTGQPLIESCGYTAIALHEAYRTEGSVEAAATAYGVDPSAIELAIRFYDHLKGPVAA
ncbi:MAG TPA: hypothetical protein VM243_08505 [Phycisphaerae bacterium]|nr:hypothetical protein [Phycisphaerae bacterium]